MSLHIEVLIDSSIQSPVAVETICEAARLAAHSRGFDQGEIGIRLTDDETIQQINQKHLSHDYPTDVISFSYQMTAPMVEGELIVSVDTAARRAAELGWNAADELLLYAIHGVLHVTGMDDKDPADRQLMRAAEAGVMNELGIAQFGAYGVDAENQP